MSLPETMRAIEVTEPGEADVLKSCERPLPSLADDEVLIKVAAAGVNRPDVLQRRGFYPPPPGASDLPGLEVAGEIVAIGAAVSEWKLGDTVCALMPGGGYAEFSIAQKDLCLPVPKNFSLAEAASLPETVFTVWANVYEDADLREGETLLVHGGTSGIGVTAIALAKATGARVIATAGSRQKCEAAITAGADLAYHYEEDDWVKEILANGGADVVLDMTGGNFVDRNLACLNKGGRHVSIAFLRGPKAEISLFPIMQKRLRISGSTLRARSAAEKGEIAGALREHIWPLLDAGKIKPLISHEFPLEKAADAHRTMEAGEHLGKIVLKP